MFVAGTRLITIYLWHVPMIVLVAGLALLIPGASPRPGSAEWWWSRPIEYVILLALLFALSFLVGRFEQPREPGPTPPVAVVAVARLPGRRCPDDHDPARPRLRAGRRGSDHVRDRHPDPGALGRSAAAAPRTRRKRPHRPARRLDVVKATIMAGTRDIRVEERPGSGDPRTRDVIVRVVAACVCGSDLWGYRDFGNGRERLMGHEMIGTIEQVGDEVTALKVGDFVISPVLAERRQLPVVPRRIDRRSATTSRSSARGTQTGIPSTAHRASSSGCRSARVRSSSFPVPWTMRSSRTCWRSPTSRRPGITPRSRRRSDPAMSSSWSVTAPSACRRCSLPRGSERRASSR